MSTEDSFNNNIRILLGKVCGYVDMKKACPATLISDILVLLPKKYGIHLSKQDVAEGRSCLAGVGGQGIVIRCYNEKEQKIAVKICKPGSYNQNIIQRSDKVNDYIKLPVIPEERFLASAILQQDTEEEAVKAPRSFVIPRVYAVENKPIPFFIMKWVEGMDVISVIKEKNNILYSLEMFLKVLDCTEFLHEQNIVYRDFKSSNFLVTYDDKIVLLDFGLAKIAEPRNITLSGTPLGSVPYASCRMLRNSDAATFIDDIHALGYVFWEFIAAKALPEYDSSPYDLGYKETYRLSISKLLPEFCRMVFLKATTSDESRAFSSIYVFKEDVQNLINRYRFNSRKQDYQCTEITGPQRNQMRVPEKIQYSQPITPLTPPQEKKKRKGFTNKFLPATFENENQKENSQEVDEDENEIFRKTIDEYRKKIIALDCSSNCAFPECQGKGICKKMMLASLDLFEIIFLE